MLLKISLFYSGLVLTAATIYVIRRLFFINKSGRLRRLSFVSNAMVDDSFPPETDQKPPIINVVMTFDECPDYDEVVKSTAIIVKYDRFRSTASFDQSLGAYIMTPTSLDLRDHIISSTAVSEEEVLNMVEKLSSAPFPSVESKPGWMIHRIVNSGIGSSAVLLRIHHCIGDGISLVSVMEKIFFDIKGNSLKFELPERKHSKLSLISIENIWRFISATFHVLLLGLSRYDSNTKFTSSNKSKVKFAKSPKVIMFPVMKLEFFKALKNKLPQTTLNDIFLSLTTGAIRKYCQSLDDPLLQMTNLQMRFLIPAAQPRSSKDFEDPSTAMSNQWTFVSAKLPINALTPLERLQGCSSEMIQVKLSPAVLIQKWLQTNIMDRLPAFIRRQVLFDAMSRHSMVFSNIPGPQKPVVFAGKLLKGLQIIFYNLVNQCIIMSYNGGVYMTMVVDGDIVKDAERLPELFLQEMKDLATELNISVKSETDVLLPK
mmetsp:Transcript_16766/g.16857  ORF Transcript_16766/g.16857 Transcript_16766/m.16857 type:complete len:486 (+) Transcript_16766:49-1506(+)